MKICVMIPTYNERNTISQILSEVVKLHLENVSIDILVIDDNSPDGTADFVASLNFPQVTILRRMHKNGLGKAYLNAITHLLDENIYDFLISMDADGSHRVADLEKIIQSALANPECGMILGSRWVRGGEIENWSRGRILLSKSGSYYAKKMLKISISDLTGGFKAYSTKVLKQIDLNKITSNGYCFQIEITNAVNQTKTKIIEIPIKFVERRAGQSKMSNRIVIEAIWQVTKWGFLVRFNPTADKLHYVK